MLEEIKNKIRSIGIQEEQVEEVFNLLSEEVFDNLFAQLADISSDEDLQVYENRINESKSPDHLQTILNEIAVTVYGDNAMDHLKNDYFVLIDTLEKSIKDAQDLVNRAQQGDQTAQDLLNKAQQTDTFKNVMEDK